MEKKQAKVYDYQARAREFHVNDWVVPFGASPLEVGRITQVWPGIAMADIEFSHTSLRLPIEDLKKINKVESPIIPPNTVSIPGGLSEVSVSAGPEAVDSTTYLPKAKKANNKEMAKRVVKAFMAKQALYWHKSDRNYRLTKVEHSSGKYCCPKKGCGSTLRKAIYKRREGRNDHLYVCPQCLFMVKDLNLHHDHIMPPPAPPEPMQMHEPMPEGLPLSDQIFIHEVMGSLDSE